MSDKKTLFALPNLLTYARIIVIPAVFWLIYTGESDFENFVACGLYALACITDYFDGYFSRKWKITSELGRFLDPIADKLLVAATLFALVLARFDSLWISVIALVIISREIFVSGLREYLGNRQVKMPVSKLAKWKTASQLFSLGFLIAGRAIDPAYKYAVGESALSWWNWFLHYSYWTGAALLTLAAALTIITGAQYMRRAFDYMRK